MLSVDQLLHGFSTQLWSQVARGLFFLKENIKYHLTVFWPPPGAPSRIYCLFQAFLCNQSRPSGQNGDNFWPRSTLQHRFACTKTFGILNPLKEMVPKNKYHDKSRNCTSQKSHLCIFIPPSDIRNWPHPSTSQKCFPHISRNFILKRTNELKIAFSMLSSLSSKGILKPYLNSKKWPICHFMTFHFYWIYLWLSSRNQ